MNKLEVLLENEIIRPIDLELCRFLCTQHPEIPGGVLLAACLTSYLYRRGDVCLLVGQYAEQQVFDDSDDGVSLKAPSQQEWVQQLRSCPAVGTPGDYKPLILDQVHRLYLHKLWHYEHTLGKELIRKSKQQVELTDHARLRDGLQTLFGPAGSGVDWQRVAAATAVKNKLSIISGGPGTGKTTTVVRILALILEEADQKGQSPDVVLAAPTGKAAARLKESIAASLDTLDLPGHILSAIPSEAYTLHQLLGAQRYSSRFRHNAENPLPFDLVVIDEASMVDQALMSKVMEALLEHSRLILLGDKDQLASVEAGSVLGDICNVNQNRYSAEKINWLKKMSLSVPETFLAEKPKALTDNITLLTKSYRFDEKSGVAHLSRQVNSGDASEAIALLKSKEFNDIKWHESDSLADLEQVLEQRLPDYFRSIVEAGSPAKALEAFNRFRIFSAHRRGPWGIRHLNQLIEKLLQRREMIPKYADWYPGRPVIINVNDYQIELFNGDTGVCLPNEEGVLNVYFNNDNRVRAVSPRRLPDHETAYALTVHKSQGSEFDEVLLTLPAKPSRVVSRELIYTAITRARTSVGIFAAPEVLRQGIEKKIERTSGLSDQLWS
ncbi:DNA helicase/exodeoxyribonuclease V, alpha subunit [Fodinibius sediminis]|uniref:DNA helicase/exodeoxyribonuclease V, alpha subunit n=2 Tax=Fodinibius sediminis TaxID=1214077 RepID=A0A521AZT2_9BACT|nr:DNA helicase/exodeoxyribonuclease V, alpha subunit [Fodinibius sediminis]